MSLINKMLQDLDARGNPAGSGLPPELRPVAEPGRKMPSRAVLGGVAAVTVLIGAGLSWRLLHKPPVPRALAPAPAAPVAPVALPPKPPSAAPKVAQVPQVAEVLVPAAVAAPAKPDEAKQATVAAARAEAADAPKAAPLAAKVAPSVEPGRELSVRQRAENAYQRALGALQEGRVSEALGVLEQALAIEPQHAAARETLIRLLLESQRRDEAMRQLQLALELDPKQPALAMMLARLQVEQGGPAIETLMRTLPFAAANGEYRAFLAAVLQREQRHKEAAEQYELALRTAPHNGVWWMGLGISLQEEQRLSEARDAFARAKVAPNLSPELQAFVERKLQQLAR